MVNPYAVYYCGLPNGGNLTLKLCFLPQFGIKADFLKAKNANALSLAPKKPPCGL
jgi:hypothetical protein